MNSVIERTHPQISTCSEAESKLARAIDRWHWLIAILTLSLVEILCFGRLAKQAGFYLDDWRMLGHLRLDAPEAGLLPSVVAYLGDPLMLIRPIQAVYFACLQQAFGLAPLGYHVTNGVFEVLSAFFLYLTLRAITGNRLAAIASAILFLIYPSHDANHYWVLSGAANLSMAATTASFWLTLKGLEKGSLGLHALAVLCFTFSIFCYEILLPLCAVNVMLCFFHSLSSRSLLKTAVTTIICGLSFSLAIASLLFYTRVIAPLLGEAAVYKVSFHPGHVLKTVTNGFLLNCPHESWAFFFSQSSQYCAHLFKASDVVVLLGLVAVITAALACFSTLKERPAQAGVLISMGLTAIICSYTIFGLSQNYPPTYQTILNRINTGAGVGVAFVIAGIIQWMQRLCVVKGGSLLSGLIVAFTTALAIFYTTTNWGLSNPWLISWQMQKHIGQSIKKNISMFKDGDSLILLNCPRYVMWSPVFDGVWDFENMLHVVTGNRKLRGGVVSERMDIDEATARDVANGVLCGVYDFEHMYVIIPPKCNIIKVTSARHFIEVVRQHGFGFQLDRGVITKWKRQLAAESGSAAN
ncbi:MAG TPA: hypothetical protein V6D17_00870 [Candidatus Obscuribacterales bacterium]